MNTSLRLPSLVAAVAAVGLCGAAGALACGNSAGYSYVHMRVPRHGYGISARIAQLNLLAVLAGHTAGFVGVGGPRQGPLGSNEWIQVGYAGFPSITGNAIYYEVAKPGRFPSYHQVSGGVPVDTYTKVTVLEMHGRRNYWRVWVNHQPVSPPIFLPESRGLRLVARSESWDGGTGGECNDFSYSFRDLSIARAPGGDWEKVTDGTPIQST
jgi:hypothetical protein